MSQRMIRPLHSRRIQCFAGDVRGKAWKEVSPVHMGDGETGVFSA